MKISLATIPQLELDTGNLSLVSSLFFQVFVSNNVPEDNILTPLVIEKLVAEIKSSPDNF